MTQTLAIFVDAYRNLNSRKLFWITLALSGLIVGSFACLGINERGIKFLIWQFDNLQFNSKTIPPATLYKTIFVTPGISIWLSWLATILALVSTAGIFPDLISQGAVDLFVSKPISRLRLFLTEYAAGLLFVTLQVVIFSLASVLVIGLRGVAWEPGLFIAVPLVVCFFSYLYAVCVLLGVVTRSTVAAVLLTLLFWFFTFSVSAAEQTVMMFEIAEKHNVSLTDPTQAPRLSTPPGAHSPSAPKTAPPAKTANSGVSVLTTVRKIMHGVNTVLPKTGETIGLLERWLVRLAHLPEQPPRGERERAIFESQQEIVQALQQRSPWWIVGTSLGFELVVLTLAAWVFCRRDF